MKFVAIFLLTGALLSASPIASLVSAGNPVLASNGEDVSPYGLTLNGTLYPVLCVDDKDWSSLNSPWNVNVTAISSGSFTNTYNPSEGLEYQEDAYLYSLIVQPAADRIDIQHAAWDIMDLDITSAAQVTTYETAGTLSSSDGAITYINQAITGSKTMNFTGYDILSDTDTGRGRQQEFIVATTPEPTTFTLLGAGLLLACVGAARRKRARVKVK